MRNDAGRPVLLLIVWVVVLGACAALAPIVQAATGVSFEWLSLVMLAPAIASIVAVVFPRWFPGGWRRARGNAVLISALLALAAVLVFFLVLSVATQRLPALPSESVGLPFLAFLLVQAIGVLSEEVGWRGVVQRTGEQFARVPVVSAIAGFVFGVTHLGYWGLGPLPVLTFGVTAALMSLTITSIFRGSFWQRMVAAVIVHLGVNMSLASLSAPEEPLATSPVALLAAAAMLAVALVARILVRAAEARQNDADAPR